MELEKKFHHEMSQIHVKAKKECKYNANYFPKMVAEHGGLKAAKLLITKDEATSGFKELWECGRLDLSVEVLVLKNEFITLFTNEES